MDEHYEKFGYSKLCGGTFLTLLLKRKRINKKTGKPNANSLFLRDLFMLIGDIFYKEFKGRSAATTTSKYKSCESINTGFLNTLADDNIKKFNDLIKNDYEKLMYGMQSYIDSYLLIDPKDPWLVYALLELIDDDIDIKESYEFYCMPDGKTIRKDDLLRESVISVPALLIGIWYYVINEKISNRIGRETFLSWTDEAESNNGERPFISEIGLHPKRKVEVTFFDSSVDDSDADTSADDFYTDTSEKVVIGSVSSEIIVGDDKVFFLDNKIVEEEESGRFDDYINNITKKYSIIKTLLYNNEPKPFYDFYICNYLKKKYFTAEDKRAYSYQYLTDVTVGLLCSFTGYAIITGSGGLGKSMMMRHLMLQSAASYDDTLRVPIFVTLKDYTSDKRFFEYIFDRAISLGLDFSYSEIDGMAKSGNFVFLLDGYDEVNSGLRNSFDSELELFVDKYSKCQFVMSSRPTSSFVSLSRFSEFELCEFNTQQAVTLIQKLEFRPDEPEIKESFINALENTLYKTHYQFIGNPLLLTIMLMTYERFAEVPRKMHIFYREAYETLSTKHDATKGAYRRKLNTGLNSDAFEKYLAEFCARTYKEEKFEFHDEDIRNAFNSLNEVKRNHPEFSYIEFKDDLTDNLCLLYREGEIYQFSHRSFQEYFSALFFSRQKDRNLYKIGLFFNYKRGRMHTDKTFEMLYDMIPEKVEEYIFLPYLDDLFKKCDSEKGYWTFLLEMYSCFYYSQGEVDNTYSNDPTQYLYSFIIKTYNLADNAIGEDDLPCEDFCVTAEYAYVLCNWRDKEEYEDEDEDWCLEEIDSIEEDYIERYGKPEIVGSNLEVSISDIIDDPEGWSDFIEAIEADSFPVLREYKKVRRFYENLKKETEKKRLMSSEDLFDMLD